MGCYTKPYVYEDRITYDYHWFWIDRAPIYYPRPHVTHSVNHPVVIKEKAKPNRDEKRNSGSTRTERDNNRRN